MILEDVNIILRCFVKIPTVGSKTVYLIRDHITFQVTYFYYTDIILFNFLISQDLQIVPSNSYL